MQACDLTVSSFSSLIGSLAFSVLRVQARGVVVNTRSLRLNDPITLEYEYTSDK